MSRSEWFNEDQCDYMESLAKIPREQRCPSGWHILATEKCHCTPNPFAGASPQEPGKPQ